jgi:type VI secretion system protein ImpL
MEQAIANIGKLYQAFNQTAGAPNEGALLLANMTTTGGTAAAASQLEALSRDMPPPVAKMLQTVAHSGSSITTTGASQEIQQAWSNRVLPLCLAAFQRYPFLPDSKADVPPDDFAKLLGPGGLMEQFFDQYLKSFVDQTSEPWRWQSTDKTPLALSPDSAAAFERAAQIRDALFPNGSAVQVKFQLVPVKLRLPVAQATVEIAGQPPLTYNNGPPEAMQFQWPGANGNTLSRLTLTPADGGPSTVYQFDDPWALLRLIDAGRLVPSGEPEKFEMMFTSPAGGAAVFDLNASSVRNPFNGALRSFRCPAKL